VSRTYDSGLAAPIRTLVRDNVVRLLAPLGVPAGGFLEAIIPIGFDVDRTDEAAIDLLWQELRGKAPAIAVAVLGGVYEPAGAPTRWRETLTIDVYVLSSHRRGTTEGRIEGDNIAAADLAADPGIDVCLELAWQLLCNADLGIGPHAPPLVPHRQDPLVAEDDKTIWRQTYSCKVTRDVNPNRNVTQLITKLMTTLKPVSDEPTTLHMVEESDR
jgi:hypothetical protein